MIDVDAFDNDGINPFDAPIPGESLTSDPNNPKPWERPPEFTDVNEAIQYMFLRLTDEENYGDVMDLIRDRTPLDEMVQMYLFKGYMMGKWTVDMMLLLMEPMLYVLIALAEHNGITDYLVYEEEETTMEEGQAIEMLRDDVNRMQPKKKEIRPVTNVLSDSLLAKIEEVPTISDMGE